MGASGQCPTERWGPWQGGRRKCAGGGSVFSTKNGDASANVAKKIADSLLSWVICNDCSVRDLVSDLPEVGKTWVKLSCFGYKLIRFWAKLNGFGGVFEGAFPEVRTDSGCLDCLF